MNRQWDTGRTEAFSDGVLGVAITLLVLDINIPQSQVKHFWYSIVHLWPTYLAYLTSFASIGGLWLVHHGILPTKLMAESPRLTDAERSAVIFYGASLLVISLLLNVMWRLVAARLHLLRPDVDDREIQSILHAATPNLGFYVIAILLAIVAPQVAAFGYLVLAILLVLPTTGVNLLAPIGRRSVRNKRESADT
jgi:TMEM175 potassium channel family protein